MNQHDDHRIDIDHELAPPDRLDAYHRRQLSAMLDGELSPDQARFMLRRLQHDQELAARWERWQVCGDVLRGRGHALLPADFSQRVAAAIASPAAATSARTGHAAGAAGGRPAATRPMGLLRWGGGALAASVALVALFMARPLPDAGTPGAGRGSDPVGTMALVESPAPVGPAATPAERATAPDTGTAPGSADVATALLAGAAPAALAVAEVPRRASERSGSRSQSQRAALRRAQAVASATPPAHAVASAAMPTPVAATSAMPMQATASLDEATSVSGAVAGGDALFGGATVADGATRPWPRAVLPGLVRRQPYAAGYGLPQPDAFAPFQPRFEPRAEPVPAVRALPSE